MKHDAVDAADLSFAPKATKDYASLFPAWDLMWSWTSRRIRARYQQSLLGWLWAIVQPAAQVAIFTLIFTMIIPVDTGDAPYLLFAYVSIVPWTFTQAALTDMAESIVENMSLVTKIYFPREVLPISAMLARLMDFAVASALIIVLLVVYGRFPSLTGLAFLPIVLAVNLALIVGVGLAAAAANAFYRDIKPLLQLTLQIWFYVSPVIYPLEKVPERYLELYSLNPVVGILQGYRSVWLGRPMDWSLLGVSAAMATVLLALGYWRFKKSEGLFADIV